MTGVRKWSMLVVLSLALAVIILDTTILNVALSSIIRDLNTDIQSIQWVITAYSLTLAALTITGGRMGDIFGRKKMFVLGAVLFAAGSFLASVSTNVGMLITGESIIEGIGAALMMPATASLLVANFQGRERAIAFGVWGGIAGASAALGPIVGGFLATNYDWRWGFRVNLVVVALLIIGSVLIPESQDKKEKPELDWLGVFLSATGMLSFVFGIIESTRYGWWNAKEVFSAFGHALTMPWGLSVVPFFVALGAIILTLFLIWEYKHEQAGHTPLVSTKLFNNRAFTSGVVTTAVMSLGQTGLIFSLPVFLQSVRELDAYHTGLALLPMTLPMLFVAPLGAMLSKKISAKTLIVIGLAFNTLAYVLLHQELNILSNANDLIPGLVTFGIGMGLVMSQINNLTLSAVEPHQAGEASGVNNTLRQVGSTLGSAVMGTILIGSLGAHLLAGVTSNTSIPETLKPEIAQALTTQTSAIEFGGGAHLSSDIPPAVAENIVTIGHQATTDASLETLVFGGFLALAGFLVAAIALPNRKKTVIESPVTEVSAPMSQEPIPTPLLVAQHSEGSKSEAGVSDAIETKMIAELIDFDLKRRANGKPGLGSSVRALIDAATIDAVIIDPRLRFARLYWDAGIGSKLGFTSFADYARSIPTVPSELVLDDAEFPHLLFVEKRLSAHDLSHRLGITVKAHESTPVVPSMTSTAPSVWTRVRINHETIGNTVNDTIAAFAPYETAADLHDGLALILAHPTTIVNQYLDLPGTPHDGFDANAACLGTWSNTTQVRWRWADHADPRCVTVSKKVS